MAFATIGTAGIQAQSIDLSTKVTGTLPVPNGGLGIASGTTGQFLKFTGTETLAPATAGISEVDQWRLTAGITSNGDVTSNLERCDSTGYSKIGTGMSESSGIFSFPSTGIYKIKLSIQGYGTSGDNINGYINISLNNFTSSSSVSRTNFSGVGSYNVSSTEYIFDVENISTHKCRFELSSIGGSAEVVGSSTQNWTYFTFIRLGDT